MRKYYKPEIKERKVYMTKTRIKTEKEILKAQKQCHEINKFKDQIETLFNNDGDIV